MIYPYSNATQTAWDHGQYPVQLNLSDQPRPMGFCDGTDADLAELKNMADTEGSQSFRIVKKLLKNGREIWTLSGDG